MVCTFAGHREVLTAGLQERLLAQLKQLMLQTDEVTFLVGGHGEFDALCTASVWKLKAVYPGKKIRLCLVLPYMTNRLNTEGGVYSVEYDDVILPLTCASVHPKAAITRRNRWMVEQADVVIAYLCRDFGGAYRMVRYAAKRKKRVILLTT